MISRKMILVVEDNALNRALLCQILAAEYDVLEAENGQAALDLLKQYGEGVSLILLDIVMPVMDGYTFLSVVKADRSLSSIPVIVTTNANDLAYHILKLALTDTYGVYHCTGTGVCSWYDFACEIIRLAGVPFRVTPCTTE